MTSSDKPCKAIRWIRLLAACGVISACTNDGGTDFCKNHYQYHDSHLDTVAVLTVKLTDDGLLVSELVLPYSIYGQNASDSAIAALLQTLRQPQKAYSLQSARDCQTKSVNLSGSIEAVSARYVSRCGSDNQLGQLDITLFDSIPELDEIDVLVTTPAAEKRFAISRQCESAIFRVD